MMKTHTNNPENLINRLNPNSKIAKIDRSVMEKGEEEVPAVMEKTNGGLRQSRSR